MHPAPDPRRRRRIVVVLGAGAVVLVVLALVGVLVVYDSDPGDDNLAAVTQKVEQVPLPAGAVLTDTVGNDAHGDVGAYLQRRYRLPTRTPGATVRAALAGAGLRVLDVQGNGPPAPVDSAIWSTYASAGSGDVTVVQPGETSGGVEVQWDHDTLYISASG